MEGGEMNRELAIAILNKLEKDRLKKHINFWMSAYKNEVLKKINCKITKCGTQ